MELNNDEKWLILSCLNTAQILGEKNLNDLNLKEELEPIDERAISKLTIELTKTERLRQKFVKELNL